MRDAFKIGISHSLITYLSCFSSEILVELGWGEIEKGERADRKGPEERLGKAGSYLESADKQCLSPLYYTIFILI